MSTGGNAERSNGNGILRLWTGVLLAPLAWFFVLSANFALVPHACAFGWEWALHLVNLVGIFAGIVATGLSWRSWRRLGPEPEDTDDNPGRSRFMSGLGILMSVLFLLVMVGQEIANIVLRPCD